MQHSPHTLPKSMAAARKIEYPRYLYLLSRLYLARLTRANFIVCYQSTTRTNKDRICARNGNAMLLVQLPKQILRRFIKVPLNFDSLNFCVTLVLNLKAFRSIVHEMEDLRRGGGLVPAYHRSCYNIRNPRLLVSTW